MRSKTSATPTPVLAEQKGKTIVIDNNEFISIAETCRYYDLDYMKVYYRLNKVWCFNKIKMSPNC